MPIAFVWDVWHYPVGTPVLVELFFITVTRFEIFRINWVMFSWQMVQENFHRQINSCNLRGYGTREIVEVARLQSEFWHERFFGGYEFSHEKCSESFPGIFEPLFSGSEKIRKIPAKFPTKFPSKKSKEIHRWASAGGAGRRNCFENLILKNYVRMVISRLLRYVVGPDASAPVVVRISLPVHRNECFQIWRVLI